MSQIILLGDSVFDNKAYVGDGPGVVDQLNDALPDGWSATLLAVDGSVTEEVAEQLGHMPDSATHLVLSSGGNDALTHEDFLLGSARSTAEALLTLSEMARDFRASYHSLLSDIGSLGLPTTVCTIYDPSWDDADQVAVASIALNGFNDVIIREAALAGFDILDLRRIFTTPQDYANPIEPSVVGGKKLADAIRDLVLADNEQRGARTTLWP